MHELERQDSVMVVGKGKANTENHTRPAEAGLSRKNTYENQSFFATNSNGDINGHLTGRRPYGIGSKGVGSFQELFHGGSLGDRAGDTWPFCEINLEN